MEAFPGQVIIRIGYSIFNIHFGIILLRIERILNQRSPTAKPYTFVIVPLSATRLSPFPSTFHRTPQLLAFLPFSPTHLSLSLSHPHSLSPRSLFALLSPLSFLILSGPESPHSIVNFPPSRSFAIGNLHPPQRICDSVF